MYEFHCGSPVCKSRLTAQTKDELMGEVAKHVAVKHRITAPSKSLVQFIEQNTIREVPSSGKTG